MHRRLCPGRDPIAPVHYRAWLTRHAIAEPPFFAAGSPQQEGAEESAGDPRERTKLVANIPAQRADYSADNRIGLLHALLHCPEQAT